MGDIGDGIWLTGAEIADGDSVRGRKRAAFVDRIGFGGPKRVWLLDAGFTDGAGDGVRSRSLRDGDLTGTADWKR